MNGFTFRRSNSTIFPFFASLLKRVISTRKEFDPLGANSFLEERTLLEVLRLEEKET